MKSVIISNESSTKISNEIIMYIKRKLPHVQTSVYNDINFENTIINEYNNGVRLFILYLVSQQLVTALDIFKKYTDAYFICPISNVIALRNPINNLYFTSATTEYIKCVRDELYGFNIGLIYNDINNIFIREIIDTFNFDNTIDVMNINDAVNMPTFLDYHQNLVVVTVDGNVYNKLNDYITAKPDTQFSVYGIEVFPHQNFIMPGNIINFTVIQNQQCMYPLSNSYWNYLVGNGMYNFGNSSISILPVLIDVRTDLTTHIKKLNDNIIISKTLRMNGALYSRYLPSFNSISIKYNTFNKNVFTNTTQHYVWLIDTSQKNNNKTYNIQYTKQINPLIGDVIFTDNFGGSIWNYYTKGYRLFILDGPSSMIKTVMNLKLNDAIFVCTKSTDDAIRVVNSNFFFMVSSDITNLEDKYVEEVIISHGKMQLLLGHSDNSNIDLIKKRANELGIANININDYVNLLKNNSIIHCIGTDEEVNDLLTYIKYHFEDYRKSLTLFRKNDKEFTKYQKMILQGLLLLSDVYKPFNSAQPFLDSDYSKNSIPNDVQLYTNLYDINAILFSFDLKFLFDFGYVTDI